MKDIVVILEDRPGTMADMGEILGAWRINIVGICATTHNGEGMIHLLVEDPAGARKALEASGIKVLAERDVLVLDINDRAGALGEITRKIADAGVNIELVYLAANTRLVVGVDDLEKAKAAF